MLRKILSSVPGLKSPRAGRFFYPRRGFGQISSRLADAAIEGGAEFILGARVTRIECDHRTVRRVHYDGNSIEADRVWSTLPVNVLARCIDPPAPAEVIEAATATEFRAMILIYLVLEQDQFTEYDAHYFPEEDIPITRLSEPKNYSDSPEPHGRTVLCAELPCDTGSDYWRMTDAELGELLKLSLDRAALPIRAPIRTVVTRRLSHAYPLYRIGYEHPLRVVDQWLDGFENLLTFGRQGLFAHDNTHHALFMAYSAVDCLNSAGIFDAQKWSDYRRIFESHVVED